MAHLMEACERKKRIITILIMHLEMLNLFTLMTMMLCYFALSKRLKKRKRTWDCYERSLVREVHFQRIIYTSDVACIENTRMDRPAFHKLCKMLKGIGGLVPTQHMCVEELVAMFLHILAHHIKNRMIRRQFVRSGETISRHFMNVLLALVKCQRCWQAWQPAILQLNGVQQLETWHSCYVLKNKYIP
jgi:hypothetical protein